MTDSADIEPDLVTHICNVLDDLASGLLDSRDDAVDAIIAHPLIQRAMKMKVVGPLELGDDEAPRS